MPRKESDLYEPARSLFRERAWRVHAELFGHDAMMARPREGAAQGVYDLGVVEMKLSFTKGLKRQLRWAHHNGDFLWAVVGSQPKAENLEWCALEDVGLVVVGADCVATVVREAGRRKPWHEQRDRLIEALLKLPPDDERARGGVPCTLGVGPAQDVFRAVEAYREKNPKATWKELYAAIPNHYASARSMAQSLAFVPQRIRAREEWKERREKMRAERRARLQAKGA